MGQRETECSAERRDKTEQEGPRTPGSERQHEAVAEAEKEIWREADSDEQRWHRELHLDPA